MIPHRLNLLPPDKYQHLKRMVSFQFIKNLLELILIIISLGGIALLGGQWVLQDYFNQIAEQIISTSNRYAATNQDIKKINFTLNKVEKIQKEYQYWAGFIPAITEKIPAKVTLMALNFDDKNKKIILTGTAVTRDDLIALKDQLNTLPWIKPVAIPPTQLTEKNNIQFSLTVEKK